MGTELIFKRPVQGVCKNYAIPGAILRRVRKLEDAAAERTLAFVVMPPDDTSLSGGMTKILRILQSWGTSYKDLLTR